MDGLVRVPLTEVCDRVNNLGCLVSDAAASGVGCRWSPDTFALLNKTGPTKDVRWAARGYQMAAQTGWQPVFPAGVHVCSRTVMMAAEEQMRVLQAAAARDRVVRAVCATWYDKTTPRARRDSLLAERSALISDASTVWIRTIARQVAKFVDAHNMLPSGVCDLEEPPAPGVQVQLGSGVDRQFAHVHPGPRSGVWMLDVRLPATPSPSKDDWGWFRLEFRTRTDLGDVTFKLPTLQVVEGTVRAFFAPAVEVPTLVPLPGRGDRVTVFGLDWGVNKLLTGTTVAGQLNPVTGGVEAATDGRPLFFNPAGLIARWHRLRLQREILASKREQNRTLAASRIELGLPAEPCLDAAYTAQVDEITRINRAQQALSTEIANLAGAWVVAQTVAAGASVIAVEDLRSLEPPTRASKQVRCKISQQLRGKVFAAVKQAATRQGIRVRTMNAAGTSSTCVRCDSRLSHYKDSTNMVDGLQWATCWSCGHTSDRDHAAAEHIAVRCVANLLTPASTPRHPKLVVTTTCDTTRMNPARSRNARGRRAPQHISNSRDARRRPIPPPTSTMCGSRTPFGGNPAQPLWQPELARATNESEHVETAVLEGCRYAHRTTIKSTPVAHLVTR